MSKNIVISDDEYILYDDYTYRCRDWEHDGYSSWMVSNDTVFVKHEDDPDINLYGKWVEIIPSWDSEIAFQELAMRAYKEIEFYREVEEMFSERVIKKT